MMYLPLDQLINRSKNRINDDDSMSSSERNTSIMDKINDNKNNFNLRKRDLYNE